MAGIDGGSKFNFGRKDASWYHDFQGDSGVYANNNYILAGIKSGKTGTLYINGNKLGDMESNVAECVHNDQPVYIGGNATTAHSMKGVICEILAYNQALTTSEIREINNYLAHKWSIN